MLKDRKVRAAITRQNHFLFFNFYFPHYVKYETAPFQKEIFHLTEREDIRNLVIVAFRGSGKSTIVTMSYPIWAILGEQQKKFVLILCQTKSQAKQHMLNLKRELESNLLLKNDLGPFQEESDEWGSSSLVFSNSSARITVASTEQSIRGLRHNQHRPDLIICDDVEDVASTKTRESRNKTYNWLTSEVIPTGDRNTRLILVGNLLHEDSLIMRIREDIENSKIKGEFREYPLIKNDQILWLGKYPSMKEIEEEKQKSGNEYSWEREYMLKIVPTEDQAIHPDWIQYYDVIPTNLKDFQGYPLHTEVRIGIDVAISQRDTADYTAMVPALLLGTGENTKIYILPDIKNERLTFPATVDLCKILEKSHFRQGGHYPAMIVEDVGYQKALAQQLEREGLNRVMSVKPGAQDKRTRLILTANLIKNGQILFPRQGAEQLIEQIVHFGAEKHDDLADAFSNLVMNVVDEAPWVPRVLSLSSGDERHWRPFHEWYNNRF